MATEARVDIASRRNEARVLTLRFVGVDWRAATFRQQVRLGPDVPGAAMLTLGTVTSPVAQGIRVAGFAIEAGVPVTSVTIRYNMTTMRDLIPFSGEIGDDARFSHAIQVDGTTRLAGDWWAVGSVMDSDAAPANRPIGYGAPTRAPGVAGAVGLTFAGEEVVRVVIDGAEIIQPLVLSARESASTAVAASTAAIDAKAQALGARDAIAAALNGYPNGATLTIPVASRLLLAAMPKDAATPAYLFEQGREGVFRWTPGNYAEVVTADPRQGVAVAPMSDATGASGVWLRVMTERALRAKWFGARGDGVIDVANNTATGTFDRPAIMAAVTFAARLRTMTIVFDDGVYLVGTGFTIEGGANAQIVLPSSANVGDEITIRFKGANPPPLSGGTNAGAILMSTDTAGLGDGVICSVIGCAATTEPEGRSWTSFYIEDMIVRTPQDTPSSGIDARYMHTFGKRRSRVDVVGGFGAGPNGVTLAQNRRPQSYGIVGSKNNIPLWGTYDESLIFGYHTGLRLGELTTIGSMCISGCTYAAELPECQHPTAIGRLLVLSCANTFKVTGAHEVQCLSLDIEHTPLPAGWDARGYDIDSDAAYLRGNLEWHVHEAPFKLVVKPGADLNVDLRQRPPFQQSGTAFSEIFEGFGARVSVSGMQRLVELRAGRLPWQVFGAARTGVDDAIGATSWCNFDRGKPDYRLAQHSVLLHGSPDNGQQVWSTARDGVLRDHLALDSHGWLYFLTPPPAYANEAAAAAAGIPKNAICERPDGTLFRQRIA